MTIAYLALGSNLGDRAANLRGAVTQLERVGVRVAAKSKIYCSTSIGSGGEGEFLNAALRIETGLSAPELLKMCQRVEASLGRRTPATAGAKREGPRTIDVDILLFGDETHDSPTLQIPHPRALSRDFVLRPLLDVLQSAEAREWGEFYERIKAEG